MFYFIKKKIINLYIKIRIQINRFINFYLINLKFKNDENLSIEFNKCLQELKINGITKLPIKLDSIDQLNIKEFVEGKQMSFKDVIKIKNPYSKPDKFGKISASIDVNSSIISELFTKDLFRLIKNYYGKTFWVRNAPTLLVDLKKYRLEEKSQKLFHIDFAERQLSIMIFLADVEKNSTHMEYIKKSQKNSWIFKSVVRENYNFKKKVNEEMSKKEIFKMVGKKGDIYIFDAGNGLHRAIYGDDRYLLHFNFAQMRSYAEFDTNFEKKKNLDNESFYHWNFIYNEDVKNKLKLNSFEEKNIKWS